MGNKILVGSNFTGFKNRIINGGFQVWQRGTSFSYDAGKNGYHTADRIYLSNTTDGQFTVSKSNIDGRNSIKFSVDTPPLDLSASKFWFGLDYRFEGQHLYDLVLKKADITISFLFKSNVSGKFNISLRNWTKDDNGNTNPDFYVTTFYYDGSETPQKIEVTIPLDYSFQNPPKNDENAGFELAIGFLNQGDYVTSTTNQWQAGNYLTTPDCVNWGDTKGNYWEIAELQLEEGDYATDFEYIPYDIELTRCMRYYEILPAWLDTRNTAGTGNGWPFDTQLQFKVVKRVLPSMSYSLKDTSFNSLVFSFISKEGCVFGAAVGSSGYGSNSYIYINSFTADAEL